MFSPSASSAIQALPILSSAIEGPVLILAPHADDESLGCGGIIAALCEKQVAVHIWLMSDGTMSHPKSRQFSPSQRRAIREAEFCQAAAILGVRPESLKFFRFPDTQVPDTGTVVFDNAVADLSLHLKELQPSYVFAPWRRDPHCDHRATNNMIRACIHATKWSGNFFEYPIWLYELAGEGDLPKQDEVISYAFHPDEQQMHKKQLAIQCHASQLGKVFEEDEAGFVLLPQVLAHFLQPIEHFFYVHEK